ncbi:MAG: hypothetical protein AAFY88_20920, partial [Acidobacteriota bacterium]
MRIKDAPLLPSGAVGRSLLRVAVAVAFTAGLAAAAGAQLEPTQLSDLRATGGLIEDVQTVADGAFTLYTADSNRVNRRELWSLDNTDGTARKLNVELDPAEQVWDFWPSPSGDRVVYLVTAPAPGLFRGFFAVDVAGGPSVPISGTLPPSPEILDDVRWTADGSRVVYGHRLVVSDPVHLLSSTADGAPPVVISGPIVDGGDVRGFDVAVNSVVFWGNLQDQNQHRVYSTSAAGGPRTELGATLPSDAFVKFARILRPDGAPPLVLVVSKEASDELYTTPVAGGALTQLPKAQPFRLISDNGEPIRFVPSANRIVYETSWERVLSQSLDGGAPVDMGSASNPFEIVKWDLTIDQARVLVLERENNVSALYSTPIAGGTPLKISSDQPSGTRIQHFTVGPDPDRFLYLADDRMQNRTELFVSSTTAVDATRLSPIDFAGRSGTFHLNYFFTADGSRAIYIADQLELGVHELFSVPLDGGPSTRLSGPLPFDADIWHVHPGPDDAHVFYTGSQNLL